MSASFRLRIITQEGETHEEEVISIIAPAEFGYLGVLAHHAPLIAACVPGKLTIYGTGLAEKIYTIGNGFLHVLNNQAILLTESMSTVSKNS